MPEDSPILSPPSEPEPILSPPVESNSPLPEESTPIIAETKDISADKLSAIQKAGMNLAIGVGSIITLVIVMVLIQTFVLMSQSQPDSVKLLQNNVIDVMKQNAALLTSADVNERERAQAAIDLAQAKVKDAIDNYSALHDSAWNRTTTLFDLIVVKALLPIFTSILGYIFGSRAIGSNNS